MRLEVVAACIRRDGRFLLCRRPEGKNCAGMWEFVGGKIEPGESPEQALKRELREELAITACIGAVLADTLHVYPAYEVHLQLFEVQMYEEEPVLLEHTEARWVTCAEAAGMALCPADRELLKKLPEPF